MCDVNKIRVNEGGFSVIGVRTQLMRRMEQPYTVHGFRASFRTWGADIAHYEHDMLEIALSHIVGDATVRAYHRSDMVEKRRKLMIEWAQYLSISNMP